MEFETWVQEHSVGDPLLDAYHHIFFQMVEAMKKAAGAEGPERVQEQLGFLMDYATMHFETEERTLQKAGYPDLAEHQGHHAIFRQRILDLQEALEKEPTEETAHRTAELARQWLLDHILNEDMKFASTLKARR